MKTPVKAVGPAFDRALEKEEAWRRQQIAALTQEQRREYVRRIQEEEKKLEAVKLRRNSEKRQRVVAKKQSLLSGKPVPELRMLQSKAMGHKKAETQAKAAVEKKSKAEIDRESKGATERLDGYLYQTERERAKHRQPDKAQDRGDDSLSRAFKKAERQKKQYRQRTRVQGTQERGKNRERDR